MKKYLTILLFFAALSLSSCADKHNSGSLVLPENKVWAHCVNTIDDIRAKEDLFEGIELDIFYSTYQNKLFVCHDEEDTINNFTLGEWLNAVRNPKKHSYWLDLKNITMDNCGVVVELIKSELNRYKIIDHAFIESPHPYILKRAKKLGVHTSLWVDNFGQMEVEVDTTAWVNKIQQDCNNTSPDALSCEWRMFDALTTFFPEKNIFLWYTGEIKPTPENVEQTRKMCRNKSVKIVLVDYNEPIDY